MRSASSIIAQLVSCQTHSAPDRGSTPAGGTFCNIETSSTDPNFLGPDAGTGSPSTPQNLGPVDDVPIWPLERSFATLSGGGDAPPSDEDGGSNQSPVWSPTSESSQPAADAVAAGGILRPCKLIRTLSHAHGAGLGADTNAPWCARLQIHLHSEIVGRSPESGCGGALRRDSNCFPRRVPPCMCMPV